MKRKFNGTINDILKNQNLFSIFYFIKLVHYEYAMWKQKY